MSNHFLVEIGCEELPPTSLQRLSLAFEEAIRAGLNKAGLTHGKLKSYATPRRLAVSINALAEKQPSRTIERKGPSVDAAFDKDGNPTPACLGFACSCKVDVKQLKQMKTDKGVWLFYTKKVRGKHSTELMPEIVAEALKHLPISKPMRWNDHDYEFIRPVHWVVMKLDEKLLRPRIFGVKASNKTYGHRFMAPEPIAIRHARDYVDILQKEGKVIVDFDTRKKKIRKNIERCVGDIGTAIIDEKLLDEVTGLVEWPVCLMGSFAKRFLQVPAEAIISAMKTHQKCFPVVDKKGGLLPYFITVSNIKSKKPERVINGNERVIRARLSDAEYFYRTDLSHHLNDYLEQLNHVVFQTKLGSVHDKAIRVSQLAGDIAQIIAADKQHSMRAGLLAKTDLVTEMVGEFPELQGTMGYYYALQEKEPKAVALAIRDHYNPRFSGDSVPETLEGCAVAIADKIDTLVGIFGINQKPTGEKDPFALRRAALGVLRIMIEKQLPLDLLWLLKQSVSHYTITFDNKDIVSECFEYIISRLRPWYLEQNISHDVFAAVRAINSTQPLDFHQRVTAVQHFLTLPQATALATANKRVSNILRRAEVDGVDEINHQLFEDDAEKELANALAKTSKAFNKHFNQANYTEALTALASLQTPVDHFFEHVMVMVGDLDVRRNRLALLANLRHLFLQIADISLLQSEKTEKSSA